MQVLVRFTLVLRAFSASLPILRESIDLWNISGITVSVYSFKEFWPQCTCIASKTWFTESIYQDCFLPNKVATRVCCMSFSKSFLACSSSLNGFFGLFSFGFSWGGAPKRSLKEAGVPASFVWIVLDTLNLWALFCGTRALPESPDP